MLIIFKLLSPLLFFFLVVYYLKKKILQATKLSVKTSLKHHQRPQCCPSQQRAQTQGRRGMTGWLVPLRSRASVADEGWGAEWAGRCQTVPCEGRAGGGVRKEEPRITARLWEHSGKARAWSLSRCQGSALGKLARIWGRCRAESPGAQPAEGTPQAPRGSGQGGPRPSAPGSAGPRGQAPARGAQHTRPAFTARVSSVFFAWGRFLLFSCLL